MCETLPPPEVVPPKKVPRVARYTDLNASRAGLVLSPLEWMWSTLRDVVGAVAKPWIDVRRHREAVGRRDSDPVRGWLQYVVADDTVRDRTPLARSAPTSPQVPAFGLEALARASVAAFRAAPSAVRSAGPVRRLFAALCFDQGVRDTEVIARRCGTTRRTIQRVLHLPPEPLALEAARLCLADGRLSQPSCRRSRSL